ncbi:AI-2E family transporter [Luedemannella helvata]|uniref:AI-2E family transporter n=1 Tax=Luedemannella helvata TaxID=349315 RepID=A0ABP4XEK3_9ACTN
MTDVAPQEEPAEPIGPAKVFVWCATGALAVLAVAVAAVLVYAARALLVQVVVAVFLAVGLDPVVRWMIARRVKRAHAVAIIALVTFAAVTALVWLFAPALLQQARELTADFPGYLQGLRERSPGLAQLESRLGLQPAVDAWVREMPGKVGTQAVTVTREVLGAVVSVLLVIVLTIYLMLDLPRLRRGLARLFPKRHRPAVFDVTNLVIDKVGSYMIGNLVISAIAGVVTFVALLALGVPFALPLALLVAVLDMIPLIGATLGAAVCVIVSLAGSQTWTTPVLVAIFFALYQTLENYLIAPRVLRDTVEISSLAVLFVALVGATVLGLIGALIAIPLAAALRVIVGDRLRARDEAAEEEAPDEPTPTGATSAETA